MFLASPHDRVRQLTTRRTSTRTQTETHPAAQEVRLDANEGAHAPRARPDGVDALPTAITHAGVAKVQVFGDFRHIWPCLAGVTAQPSCPVAPAHSHGPALQLPRGRRPPGRAWAGATGTLTASSMGLGIVVSLVFGCCSVVPLLTMLQPERRRRGLDSCM